MREALDPISNHWLTIIDYLQRYGRKTPDGSKPLQARCPYCRQQMGVREGANNAVHFYHLSGSGFCPSKTPLGEPYLRLEPTAPDLQHAQKVRKAFAMNWRLHWFEMKRIVPCLSTKEWISVLDEMERRRIWQHKALAESDLPYIFVITSDFPPKTGIHGPDKKPCRQLWFRFWYESNAQTLDSLWIELHQKTLYRASFEASRRGRPKFEEDHIATKAIERTDFLSLDPVTIKTSPVLESTMAKWLRSHDLA